MTLDLNTFKQKLLAFQVDVVNTAELAGIGAQPVELDQNRVGRLSRMDAMQGQAIAQASAQRQQALLSAIDRALMDIDSGDYGRCVECDEYIATARLEIDLTAQTCIACAAKLEREV